VSAGDTGAPGEPIAIIGMRGRFPGASNLDAYWQNLADGVESISTLSADDMREAGIPENVSGLPGYVNAAPLLDDVDQFDAEFFGFSARDATLTDPQHRLFLECCWEALEDAAYDPAAYPGEIGVFGGCEMSTYLYQLYQNADALQYVDGMQLMVTNDKDHLCTQTSYRMNLRGPSVVVQTTCSTSLVAVSLACESLMSERCGIAMAGGVTVRVPQKGGYLYAAGSILSPDGHCRPFDANAQGTIVGSGVGVVVLKRLRDAIRDRDNVRAVILGIGINNDGNDKVGYTAPSFHGQAGAIRAAHASAGVPVESIGYVEAHGTGTILGDPIEVSALTEAFSAATERRGFCGIGSAKSNFGHLSCAAGVAGLIKAVLATERGAIPPTVHYTSPNPAIDFASSPFYVSTELTPWKRNGAPRRAAVSSFGVGGTNAHLVIEEAPARAAAATSRSHQLLTMSARSETAVSNVAKRLATHLRAHPDDDIADVAYTLHVGRQPFRHRVARLAASDDRKSAIGQLTTPISATEAQEKPVVFLFPGQGAQYPGMAAELYQTEPRVRQTIDHCADVLHEEIGADLRELLFPSDSARASAEQDLRDTRWAQPALFTIGYALAVLWQSWGIKPAAFIGHSVGEYVAATLAGVMQLDDALALIAKRGRMISALPGGSMLAVMAPLQTIERYTGGDVAIAALNAPGYAVLSGPAAAIDKIEHDLSQTTVTSRRLHTSHAFHSPMMEPMLEDFEEAVAGIPLTNPSLPLVETLSGTWTNGNVVDPGYWSAQIRSTVHFSDAVRTVIESPMGKNCTFLEIGPGNTLATFSAETARAHERDTACLTSLPGPQDPRSDTEVILSSLGQLWEGGADIDWEAFHAPEPRNRLSLPTYPFERRSYWVGPGKAASKDFEIDSRDTADWFYRPEWQTTEAAESHSSLPDMRALILDEGAGLGAAVAEHIRVAGGRAVLVTQGHHFARLGEDSYELDVDELDGFRKLAAAVCTEVPPLGAVVDCWSAAPPGHFDLDSAARLALLAPMRLVHALGQQTTRRPLPLLMAARGTTIVDDGDPVDPVRALGSGVAKVLPQEHPGIRVAHVDIDDHPDVARHIVDELAAGLTEPAVALRGDKRYIEAYTPTPITDVDEPRAWPDDPVVMVTGGLGHMGINLAEGLFDHLDARLVLLGRSEMPPPDEWRSAADDRKHPERTRELLTRLADLHAQRPDVLVVNADLNDRAAVQSAVDEAVHHFGRIDVVVHGAARIDPAAFGSAAETGMDIVEAQFSPKLRGLYHLIDAFAGREPGQWILHSSISTVLGGLGLAAYSAANAVLDALALKQGAGWLSIDWDLWDNAAEAHIAGMPAAIRPQEGLDAFLRLIGADCGRRVLVAVDNLEERLESWVRHDAADAPADSVTRHPRPNLSVAYVEPGTDTEKELAEIWGAQLGVEQVGIHDRFFDLGGHSLLAVQVASEIRDRFQIEMPVLELFQAPTVAQLAVVIEKAQDGTGADQPAKLPFADTAVADAAPIEGDTPEAATKAGYREFYDDVTQKLAHTGVAEASFFLNYGYVGDGNHDEAVHEVPEGVFNPNSVRLAFELLGTNDLSGKRVLDVGCGRGGTAALIADTFEADVVGVDLSPEAIAFCQRTHQNPRLNFDVGDAENLPAEAAAFDIVTNLESSHTYPNLRAFYAEVARVLAGGGLFLYTDLLPVTRWAEVRVLLPPLGLELFEDRDITSNVLASCDEVADTRAQAFGGNTAAIDNFLAVPGSMVYEQMNSGAWQYRIVRANRA